MTFLIHGKNNPTLQTNTAHRAGSLSETYPSNKPHWAASCVITSPPSRAPFQPAALQHRRLIERLEVGFDNVGHHADNFLEDLLPTRTNVRNASFTDFEVRNIFATSGESTTTLLPSAYRFAYLPRTPLLKSYSGSMSGRLSWTSFFIGVLFTAVAGRALMIRIRPLRSVWATTSSRCFDE